MSVASRSRTARRAQGSRLATGLVVLLLSVGAGTTPGTKAQDPTPEALPTEVPDEQLYSVLETLSQPPGVRLEIGGMDTSADGRLFVSTRRGQVWIVEGLSPGVPLSEARLKLFAEGLVEGMGLKFLPRSGPATDPLSGAPILRGVSRDEDLYVLQRGELSRLVDLDGDDVCDVIETVCDEWGLSDNYHEFAFGLPADARGRLYVTLNVSFDSPLWYHGIAPVPWRGWIVAIDPQAPRGQRMTPIASGLRSPCGVAAGPDGTIFVTDNQGDWLAACPLLAVREGAFYNHPASLDWHPDFVSAGAKTSLTQAPDVQREPAVLWLPYKWSRSTGDLAVFPQDGPWGPFGGQLLIAELTNGMLLRALLQEVSGVRQGAVVPFRSGLGSAIRVRFAADGSILLGLTNRGWGGQEPDDGLQRLRPTGRLPLEYETITLVPDGFELRFTQPLRADLVVPPGQVVLSRYDYDWWWEYGSPERRTETLEVLSTQISEDRRTLTLRAAGLQAGTVARCRIPGLISESGEPLLHDEFAYTINQMPGAPFSTAQVVKAVPPPPARATGEEGWLRPMWLDATNLWEAEGWQLADVDLDRDLPGSFRVRPGSAALVNRAGPLQAGDIPAGNLVSRLSFGDFRLRVEVMLAERGSARLWIFGRHGLELADRAADAARGFGTIIGRDTESDVPAAFDAYQGAGRWHTLDLVFEAPRLDAAGAVQTPARFARVLLDDVLLHENVPCPEPGAGAPASSAPTESGQSARGPIVFDGAQGPLALRNLRVFPLDGAPDDAGFVPIFNGSDLGGWRIARDDTLEEVPLPPGTHFSAADAEAAETSGWSVEDGVLIGRGPRSHLFSPRGDFRDVTVRARVRISSGGNSGLYLRATAAGGWPAGYEAQINSDHADPQKTASVYDRQRVTASLVGPGTWFDYEFSAREEPDGTRLVTAVNGIVIADVLDAARSHPTGHVALQQHHEGSVVEFRDLRVRVH